MRKLSSSLAFLFLAGCSQVLGVVRPLFGQGADTVKVAPSFTLSGPARIAQDSLKNQLQWLSTRPLPSGWRLGTLAFRNRPDSTVELVALLEDSRRLNSHGYDRAGMRTREAERANRERPLWTNFRQAGILSPLVVRAAFSHKDYLFQNARTVEDTVEVPLADSAPAKPHD